MTLTLVIPDLLWPRQVMQNTLHDADFPALQTLLGKGRMAHAVASAEAWWAAHFGIEPDAFAAAPLRRAALGGVAEAADDARWLCVDPVHLRLEQKGAMLTDPAALDLDAAEAAQLHAALAPLFAEVGELLLAVPTQWHLRLTAEAPALPTYLGEFIGASATALMPSGAEGRPWRQLINEAQMALHAHPVNAAREARGKAAINSIALWGEGRAPTLAPRMQTTLLSDDPIVSGAGRLAGMRVAELPARFVHGGDDRIVHLNALRVPSAEHDALTWLARLQQIDDDWLAPALAALAAGELKRIELHGFGAGAGFSVEMSNVDRYCFWRKARRLETL